jgi:selenocysteine lyase/cysteine desulfurase
MVGGLMANTHTEDSYTGRVMTTWLYETEQVIKKHVNASTEDVLLNVGSGIKCNRNRNTLSKHLIEVPYRSTLSKHLIETPYRNIAKIMHENSGVCFVDFAASAPYVEINMHPTEGKWLDAIFFSPHKFLGGPGSSGVLLFNKYLYQNKVLEQPGGGTVLWTNPWGEHRFIEDIEQRESSATPAIL